MKWCCKCTNVVLADDNNFHKFNSFLKQIYVVNYSIASLITRGINLNIYEMFNA